jgi:hypothetical protein
MNCGEVVTVDKKRAVNMKKIMLAGFVAMCAGFSVAATPLLQLDFNTENGAASLLDCASGMKWDGTTAAVIVESTPVSQSGCVGSVKNNDAKKQYFQTKRFFAGFLYLR